ncbi:hypothetical protein C5746_01420 [Streptomyces atratus]|uniref:Uncharacterized protein n=1 Tax=Streptomyces atratus TaxID=1893 RepID=A0A2Z5J6H8_STRAR|nr:hypothetical protein C5746_01420 [Streptomyces atratus]
MVVRPVYCGRPSASDLPSSRLRGAARGPLAAPTMASVVSRTLCFCQPLANGKQASSSRLKLSVRFSVLTWAAGHPDVGPGARRLPVNGRGSSRRSRQDAVRPVARLPRRCQRRISGRSARHRIRSFRRSGVPAFLGITQEGRVAPGLRCA